jgi:hypothetical protein
MGLDCYIVHSNDREKPFTAEDDPRIKDINLCGGMMSGHGADGSFRGKAYEPLMDELMGDDGIWHMPEDSFGVLPEWLKEQAQALADLLHAIESDAKEEERTLSPETIIYQTRNDWEYTYQEVQDLELLLRCASERGAVMLCWW